MVAESSFRETLESAAVLRVGKPDGHLLYVNHCAHYLHLVVNCATLWLHNRPLEANCQCRTKRD